ncbi:tRNA pseudouridine(55) synthase TruB [Salinicoccus hispanicus]|uniref:tRNA pseudouridine synthase B n=1 Tax=Salinicoccus hispanicus TaxID=157225 RepID=A0A6N8U0P4_9STAP|nr:tRNA pseudouridine(55) synthase TruB [Salinicoccus hispanicus]MXQ49895.1 tRNA pseudouridine(55) synthase TruB [Salinicoccus hispanicus]
MHGVIPINKPKGLTSHDVVVRMRKILHMKKVGHTGTLDPEVTGVLPIVIGDGTKLTEYMQTKKKRYRAEVTLGFSTDTEDQTGTVEARSDDLSDITDKSIDQAVEGFTGNYLQQVPKYASVRVDGRKLYEYARQGIEVERPIREVHIHSISRTSDIDRKDGLITFEIDVECSKGTYIRTLAVDIGRALGVAAHMSHLVRTESCGITLEQTVTLEALQEADPEDHIVPIAEIIESLPTIDITDADFLFRIRNGQKVGKSDIMDKVDMENVEMVALKHEGVPIGIYYDHPEHEGLMKPYQMFNL